MEQLGAAEWRPQSLVDHGLLHRERRRPSRLKIRGTIRLDVLLRRQQLISPHVGELVESKKNW